MTDERVVSSTTTTVKEKQDDQSLLQKFLKATGYKASDVLDQNDRRRVFVTTNGGKYQLTVKGSVRRLGGPEYPKENEE